MRGHSYIVEASCEAEAAMLYGKHHEIDSPTEVHVSLIHASIYSYLVYKNALGAPHVEKI